MLTTLLFLVAAAGAGTGVPTETGLPPILEGIAKLGIQAVLSHVLDTQVALESVKLDAKAQALEIRNLAIANPKGYSAQNAMLVQLARIEAEPKLLFSPEPQVRLIDVEGPKINVEMGPGGSNLMALLHNAQRGQTGHDNKKSAPKEKEKEKQWRIEKGVLKGAEVTAANPLSAKPVYKKTIGDIEMDFVGEDGTGMPAQQAMSKFLSRLLKELGLMDNAPSVDLPGLVRGVLGK